MIQKWKIILAFAVIYLVWGTTYLAILFAIKDIPPFLMSGMRFLFAGIILYFFCLVKKEQQPNFLSFSKNVFRGILMLVGGTVSVTWAEQYLPSSTAAIIVTSVPFWFVILDRKQWKFYFSNKVLIIGLLIDSLDRRITYFKIQNNGQFTFNEHCYPIIGCRSFLFVYKYFQW